MKIDRVFAVFIVCAGFSLAMGQTQPNPVCVFGFSASVYTCSISGFTLVDENANLVFEGIHLEGQSDADVDMIGVINSNISIIMTQLFTRFPNVGAFYIDNGGLARIQPNAFANAKNLTNVFINYNQELQTIQANAFTGASNLLVLDIGVNRIVNIHETAFNGLNSLQILVMDRNLLTNIPPNLFSSLSSLLRIDASFNARVESLDGRTFENNPLLTNINFNWNGINAIGRNFLDGLPRLQFLSLLGNRCIDFSWNLSLQTENIDVVRQALEQCFENFVEVPGTEAPPPENNDLRRFILELRGPFSLRYENGTEIVRV